MPWIKWITELYVWMSDIAFCIIYCSNIPWVSQYYSRASKQTELPEGLWFGRSSPFVCRGHDLFTLARNIYSAGCSNADYQLRPLRTGNNANWWIDISKWISMFSIISDREGERDIKGSIKEIERFSDLRRWDGREAGPGRRRPKLEIWRLEQREQQTRAVTLISADSQHRPGRWALQEQWSQLMVNCERGSGLIQSFQYFQFYSPSSRVKIKMLSNWRKLSPLYKI